MAGPREQIVVRIAPDGAISAETQGIKGARCMDYIAVLEDLLDAQTSSSAFTPEYHESAQRRQDEVPDELQQR